VILGLPDVSREIGGNWGWRRMSLVRVEPGDDIVDLEPQEPALLQAWEPQQKEARATDAMGV
jgi:hypothetical protein